jgi:ketosteroid isomerase-like protein
MVNLFFPFGASRTATSATDTVREFVRAWSDGDIDRAMSVVAEDAVYELHISNEVLPLGGETRGRAAITKALADVRDQFEYLLYRGHNYTETDDTVRYAVEFMYRHRLSDETLSGRFRVVMKLRGGLIVRADEYHDRALVEAFMRLVAMSAHRF